MSRQRPAGAAPVRVAVSRWFAFPLRHGFDYISDIDCWPDYWPNLVRVAPNSRWAQAGDRAAVTLKLLGRATELERRGLARSRSAPGWDEIAARYLAAYEAAADG